MKLSKETAWTVIGITAVAGATGVAYYTVKTLMAGGSTLTDAISNATTILANDVGVAVKAVLVGVGVGLLVFLLLPPPFDLIALGIVAAAAIVAAFVATDNIAKAALLRDSFEISTAQPTNISNQVIPAGIPLSTY